LVVLGHGIGPQNARAQWEFLDRLQDTTTRRLEEIGKAGLAARLVLERADWSRLFSKRSAWLRNLFPNHADVRFRSRRTLTMLLWLSLIPALDRKSTRLNSSHPSRSRMPSSA